MTLIAAASGPRVLARSSLIPARSAGNLLHSERVWADDWKNRIMVNRALVSTFGRDGDLAGLGDDAESSIKRGDD